MQIKAHFIVRGEKSEAWVIRFKMGLWVQAGVTQATAADKGALPGATPLELPLQKGWSTLSSGRRE